MTHFDNFMGTIFWLVKINILSFIEPIRDCIRCIEKKTWNKIDTFSKPYLNWLNKKAFHDMNQSAMALEGQ